MKTIDEDAAIKELSSISKNAQLFLMDRIGNNLNCISLNYQLQRYDVIPGAIKNMLADLRRIGLFKLRRGWDSLK